MRKRKDVGRSDIIILHKTVVPKRTRISHGNKDVGNYSGRLGAGRSLTDNILDDAFSS